MRVVEADDGEAARAGVAPGVNVGPRIDQETPRRIGREVRRSDRLADLVGGADEYAAALTRQRRAGVFGDLVERGRRNPNGYNASTAIAIPIPPPMQSDATP